MMGRFAGQDTRQASKVRHPIQEVLTCIIIGMMAGRNRCNHALQWCKNHLTELRRFMPLKHGVASPPTATRVMKLINIEDLQAILMEWACMLVRTCGAFLSVDGKGITGAAKKIEGESTPYEMNVVDIATKLCVAAISIGSKENEKVAFHNLLEEIDIEGSLLTADAMATDQNIMRAILQKGGDFVFQVKKNNPEMYEQIQYEVMRLAKMLENEKEKLEPGYEEAAKSYTHIDKTESNGGRDEYRECWATNDVSLLESTQDKHPYLNTIASLRQIRIKKTKEPESGYTTPSKKDVLRQNTEDSATAPEGDGIKDQVYRIQLVSSLVLTAEEILACKRAYWTIENPLHNVLDNVFKEDRDTSTVNRDCMAILRRFAYNVVRVVQIREKRSLSMASVVNTLCDDFELAATYVFRGIASFG